MLPIKSVACMLFFVLNFLDECTGRFVPLLYTYLSLLPYVLWQFAFSLFKDGS